jgi:dynein heavy chain
LNAIEKQSVPARNLAEWASAISKYQKVWKEVEPKKAKLAEMTKIVNEA